MTLISRGHQLKFNNELGTAAQVLPSNVFNFFCMDHLQDYFLLVPQGPLLQWQLT